VSGLLLLWVGRRAPAPIEALADEYKRRLARHLDLAEVRVKPAVGRADARRVLAEEAVAIRRHLTPTDAVVALDERGRERNTEEFANWLEGRHRQGRLALIIGSDLGLDAEFKRQASELLALSRLTLSHQIARVLLLEQLYRACDWVAGGAYHRDGTA
jgi:23S rRNA (pseudouridine1915-N3)-methyltransferase